MNIRLIWGFVIFLILAGFRLAFVETKPVSLVIEEDEPNSVLEESVVPAIDVTGSSTPEETGGQE